MRKYEMNGYYFNMENAYSKKKRGKRKSLEENRRIGERITVFALLLLFCCPLLFPFPVQAAKNRETIVSAIYHYHAGNPKEEGGCYTKAVPHKHTGNAGEEGGCYRTPVYHIHTGDRKTGGGCYGGKIYHVHTGSPEKSGGCFQKPVCHRHSGSIAVYGGCYIRPVYHVHAGSAEAGGPCYEPVCHVHTDSCYEEASCMTTLTGGTEVVRTYNEYCAHHGNTQHAEIRGVYQHSDCGLGMTEETRNLCWTCQIYNGSHSYRKLVCGKNESTIEGYRLKCTDNDKTVERWETGCGKTESSVECYELSCGKTKETVEAYERICDKDEKSVDAYALSCKRQEGETESYAASCERKEKQRYAVLTLSREEPDTEVENTVLQAKCTDESGYLTDWNGNYRWSRDGVELQETGENLEISENGNYTVSLPIKRADLKQEELGLSVEVKNIRKPSSEDQKPEQKEETDEGAGGEKKEETEDTSTEDKEGEGADERENGKPEEKTEDKSEDKREEKEEKKEEGGQDGGGKKKSDSGSGENGGVIRREETDKEDIPEEIKLPEKVKKAVSRGKSIQKAKAKKAVLPQGKKPGKTEEKLLSGGELKDYTKKEEEVRSEPVAAEPVQMAAKQLQRGAAAEPVIKAVTFTVGIVAAAAGILWLLYLMYYSVRVYHRDGEEKYHYAGSCMLKKKEDGFGLAIPQGMVEQSETGLFILRPGTFFNRVNKGKELFICAGRQKESVWIDGEIPLHVFPSV